MKTEDLVTALRAQLNNCAGFTADEHQKARVDALNYYFQRPRGDEVNGRSQVVSGDVSASVEANLAQISDAFSSDSIIEFDPLGPEDEDQVQLESDAVVHFVMKANPGSQELKAAIKDALQIRNGFIKVWVDEFTQSKTRTFDNVAPEVVDELAAKAGAEVVSYSEKTLRLRVTKTHKKFRAYAVDPANFYYPKDWYCFDLQEVPFCAERHVDTRSDLVRMGFPKAKVKDLKAYAASKANRPDEAARDPLGGVVTSTPSADPSQDQIEWFECYWLSDVDDDGIAERRRVAFVWNDAAILEDEPVALVPYAAGAVMVNPHRLTGISQFDKLRQVQDIATGLYRALFDNVNAVTKNRIAYLDGKVNVDDVSDGRPNGAIRVRSNTGIEDVRAAVMPFAVNDNSPSVLANIEAMKRVRAEMGGAALDMQSAQSQLGDIRGSQGVDRVFSVMEQLAALMTKNIAETLIRNTFLLAHATLREHWDQPVQLKRNGKWQSATPTEWQMRDRVTVKVGMSPGERARMIASLDKILANQVTLAQLGMDEVLVNLEGFYRVMMDRDRVSGIQNPEQYYVDPQSDDAKKALEAKSQSAQQETQQKKALVNRAIGNEETKTALDKYKHDSELQFKYFGEVNKSDIAEAQIVGQATTQLLTTREQGQQKADGTQGTSEAAESEPASRKAA